MDEELNLIRSYIVMEFEAFNSLYTDPDDDVLKAKVADVERLISVGDRLNNGLYRGPLDERGFRRWRRSTEGQYQRLTPRVIFQAKKYHHPSHGDLVRFYLSDVYKYPLLGYARNYIVSQTEHGLRIVAQYANCSLGCRGASVLPGNPDCEVCGSMGMEHLEGVQFRDFGDLVEVRKFQPPTDPIHLAEFHLGQEGNWV